MEDEKMEENFIMQEIGENFSMEDEEIEEKNKTEDVETEETIYEESLKGIRCKLCNIIFHKRTKYGALSYHRMKHFGFTKKVKNFKCNFNLCDKAYKTKNALDRHMNKNHSVPTPKPHQCPYCDQAFIRMKKCKQHMRTHKNDGARGVKPCQKQFFRPKNPDKPLNINNMTEHLSRNPINNLNGQKLGPPQTKDSISESSSNNEKMKPFQLVNSLHIRAQKSEKLIGATSTQDELSMPNNTHNNFDNCNMVPWHQSKISDNILNEQEMIRPRIKNPISENISSTYIELSRPNIPVSTLNDNNMAPWHLSKKSNNSLNFQKMVQPQTKNPISENPFKKQKLSHDQLVNSVNNPISGNSSKYHETGPNQLVNSVSKLYLLHRKLKIKVKQEGGPKHAPLFGATFELNGQIFKGSGRTKKQAKQAAADAYFMEEL